MKKSKPTYQELEKRLAVAEPIIAALKHHEVDAVVGQKKLAFLLLKEVREELVSSDAGFRAMFDLPGVGMVQADAPAFRFSRVNQKFCDMTGYSGEELRARTYIDLTDPRDRRRDMNALAQVLRGKTDAWSIEKRCIRKDGSIIRVGVHGTALRDDAGLVVRIVAMISDLTPRKATDHKQLDGEKNPKRRVSSKPRLKRR